MPVSDWGRLGARAPTPHEEAAVSVLKKIRAFICTVMVWRFLGCFGVVWGGLGYFKAVGFQKRNLANYMYGDGLVVFGGVLGWFGVFWVGLGISRPLVSKKEI